jgi:hypothetical protein
MISVRPAGCRLLPRVARHRGGDSCTDGRASIRWTIRDAAEAQPHDFRHGFAKVPERGLQDLQPDATTRQTVDRAVPDEHLEDWNRSPASSACSADVVFTK